jgi:hypothetical protein
MSGLRDGATQDTGRHFMIAQRQVPDSNRSSLQSNPVDADARPRLARLVEPVGIVLLGLAMLVLAGAILLALLGSFVIWLIVFWLLAAEVVAADLIRRIVSRLRPPVSTLKHGIVPAGQ